MIGYRLHGHTAGHKTLDCPNPFAFDRCVAIAPPTPGQVEAPRLLLRKRNGRTRHRLNYRCPV
jgi:hypothetical protein